MSNVTNLYPWAVLTSTKKVDNRFKTYTAAKAWVSEWEIQNSTIMFTPSVLPDDIV